jgi:hypothetical protein
MEPGLKPIGHLDGVAQCVIRAGRKVRGQENIFYGHGKSGKR